VSLDVSEGRRTEGDETAVRTRNHRPRTRRDKTGRLPRRRSRRQSAQDRPLRTRPHV